MTGKKHLIIGAGSAAMSALEKIRTTKSQDEIKVVTAEDYPPYSPTALPYLLSGRITEDKLPLRDSGFFERMEATLVRGKQAAQVLPQEGRVVYQDGASDQYDTLLVASGSQPIQPPILGLAEAGFQGFRTIADYRHLMGAVEGGKQIAILGAGLIGMELAAGLLEKGVKVIIMEKEPRVLPLYFDGEAEDHIKDIFLKHGAEIHAGDGVTQVAGSNGRMEIGLASGVSIEADLLLTCVGVRARTDFLENSGIVLNQGIVTDRTMRTNIPNIYAAGDVAEAPDFFTGQPGLNPILPNAVAQGKVAGSNMAGEPAEYEGWISSNVFHFFGNMAFSAGLAMSTDPAHQIMKDAKGSRGAFRKLVLEGERLVGAMFLNVPVDPGVIIYLMGRRIGVAPHAQAMLESPRETSRWLMMESERKETFLDMTEE